MSVSTLANTKWVIKDTPTFTSQQQANAQYYDINFKSNNINFHQIVIGWTDSYSDYEGLQIAYGDNINPPVDCYHGESPTGWTNQAYKTIEISSGTDATNPDLIVWFTENATLQNYEAPIDEYVNFNVDRLNLDSNTHYLQAQALSTGYEDSELSNAVYYNKNKPITLIGSSWQIQDAFADIPAGQYEFNINFTSNNTQFIKISIGYNQGTQAVNSIDYVTELNNRITVYNNGWSNQAYRTIAITSGEDVLNNDLMNWLLIHSVLVSASPKVVTFNFTDVQVYGKGYIE